jgi:hypothetical protein
MLNKPVLREGTASQAAEKVSLCFWEGAQGFSPAKIQQIQRL